jgi:hypothetical protein
VFPAVLVNVPAGQGVIAFPFDGSLKEPGGAGETVQSLFVRLSQQNVIGCPAEPSGFVGINSVSSLM